MMPLSEIKVGDVFSNPMHRGFGSNSGLEWVVEDIKDGLVKLQGFSYSTFAPIGSPVWKKPSDRMLSEYWRLKPHA